MNTLTLVSARRNLATTIAKRISFVLCCGFVFNVVAFGDVKSGLANEPPPTDKPTIAFVTNQIASFWNIAKIGCEDAAEDFDVNVDVRFPSEATATKQKQIIEDLLASGIDALAISPIDATNQGDALDAWAAKIPLITHDSDAPDSNRLLYIGCDNYAGGRLVGKIIKQAFPDGGNVILCIGRTEQDNSKKRVQGVIDELMDRPLEFRWRNELTEVVGDKFTVLATLTDQGAAQVAKQKAEDALNTYPDIDVMVGLFAYNPPAILQALRQANKIDKIKVAAFDEDDATLQGIKEGSVIGTVVQNPYEYGYQSVRVLSKILAGDKTVIPKDHYIDVPARLVTKDGRKIGGVQSLEIDEFWADLKDKTGQ